MRIAIDAFDANLKLRVGMGNYCLNLIKELSVIDQANRYLLYFRKPQEYDFSLGDNFDLKPLFSPRIRTFWSRISLGLALARSRPDIVHIPTGHKIPWACPGKVVVTIHDLAFLKFPAYFQTGVRWRLEYFTRHALTRADRIIAISETTKKDIIYFYRISPEKISVISHGVDESFRVIKNDPGAEALKLRLGINRPFILYVGVVQPRKNISRLIRAFALFREKTKLDYQLVLAGPKGWICKEIFQEAEKNAFSRDIVFTGYLEQPEIVSLLNCAGVFALPSLYEGFGLPLLEAMACGAPVLTSNVSSLPEVSGDAAILVNPYSELEIAQGLEKIVADEKLRTRLIERGAERARQFTWRKTAQQTLAVYNFLEQKT